MDSVKGHPTVQKGRMEALWHIPQLLLRLATMVRHTSLYDTLHNEISSKKSILDLPISDFSAGDQ